MTSLTVLVISFVSFLVKPLRYLLMFWAPWYLSERLGTGAAAIDFGTRRGAGTLVLGRLLGSTPSEEIASLMAQAFWDAWEDRLGQFERRPPRIPR